MRLSMSVGYYLKDRPKDHRGITQETVSYGKDRGAPFSRFMVLVFADVLKWYIRIAELDDLNAELEEFKRMIADVKVIEDK